MTVEQEYVRRSSHRTASASKTAPHAAPRQQRDRFGTGGRGLPGLLWNRGAGRRERELSAKLGISVGPDVTGGTHFSHSELNKIDKVLSALPENDLKNDRSTLRSVVRGGGQGMASLYDPDTSQIHIQHLAGLPGWLYTRLQMGSGWQRRLMDLGAAAGYDGLSIAQRCSVMGCSRSRRQVMGGALAHGSLLGWTLRHEIGHSVDQRHQWALREAQQPEFGGWCAHLGPFGCRKVARAFLTPYGITDDDVCAWLAQRIAPDRDGALNLSGSLADEFTRVWPSTAERMGPGGPTQLVKDLSFATAQPWMLPGGGADRLARDGRVYQVNQYGDWCSYLATARDHAVSPYQFSSVEEWFAEAYAAFHDPVPGSAPRGRLHPGAVAWFEAKARGE